MEERRTKQEGSNRKEEMKERISVKKHRAQGPAPSSCQRLEDPKDSHKFILPIFSAPLPIYNRILKPSPSTCPLFLFLEYSLTILYQKDIATAAKWMVDEYLAAGISKKLGIIGFCFGGGRVIEVLSRDQGICFGIGVSFYGTRMDPNLASNVKVPVLLISGDDDPLCSVNVLKDIEKCLREGSKVIIFEGRGHGFAHRPNSPEEDRDAEWAL